MELDVHQLLFEIWYCDSHYRLTKVKVILWGNHWFYIEFVYFDNIISSAWKILNFRNTTEIEYKNAFGTWKSDMKKKDKNKIKAGLQHVWLSNGIDLKKKSFALHTDRSYIYIYIYSVHVYGFTKWFNYWQCLKSFMIQF